MRKAEIILPFSCSPFNSTVAVGAVAVSTLQIERDAEAEEEGGEEEAEEEGDEEEASIQPGEIRVTSAR